MRKIAFIVLMCLAACDPRRGPEDQAAVWDFVLTLVVREPGRRGKYVVLQDQTSLGPRGPFRGGAEDILERFRTDNVEIPDGLVERFVELNRTPVEVASAFPGSRRVGMISGARTRELFSGRDVEADWEAFYTTYSGAAGLFQISRVAFFRNLALVHVFLSCGSACAVGRLFLLRATYGTWVVQGVVTTGIS